MVRLLPLLILLLSLTNSVFSQTDDNRVFFSEALAAHLPKYDQNAKAAYYHRDYEEGQRLFDSLIEHGLNGSYMDNFKFSTLNKKESSLYEFKKPIYLITYASWCITTEGEIPAINQLASKYSDKIDFVILFWDDQKTTKKMSKSYNEHIKVRYVNEMNNKDSYVISKLKHSLGLPTTFLIDGNKKILDIRRGISHPYGKSFEKSFDMNYNSIYDGIANHLLDSNNYNAERETVALN